MKAVLINGSPRKGGNTEQSLEMVAGRLNESGIETEIVPIGNMRLYGCQACLACRKLKNRKCAYGDIDGLNEVLAKVFEADILVIGSPTYYSGVTAEVKAFIDRCGYVAGANGQLLRRKIGAAVVAVRRSGANVTYAQIQYLFGISEMPIATSTYWNMTLALSPGEVQADEEGKRTFLNLADNIAWMAKGLSSAR